MTRSTAIAISRRRYVPNKWDWAVMPLILAVFVAFGSGAHHMAAPLAQAQASSISLDPANLPEYAVRTVLRMLAAMVCSLLFTFTYATWAAKSRRAELILIPVLDILQSVPVLGFISITVTWFLSLTPGRVLGAELASIFAIFTSQAWNMAFSFYQSLRTEPKDLVEACRSFHLSPWQRFCRLDVPYALPGLVWNMMMSMSGGWFFVVASEAVTVGNKTFTLPGIGAYVAAAIENRNLAAVGWAVLAMLAVILLYDQIMFRPLVAWANKFKFEQTMGIEVEDPWLLRLVSRTRLLTNLWRPFLTLANWLPTLRLDTGTIFAPGVTSGRRTHRHRNDLLWKALVIAAAAVTAVYVARFILTELSLYDIVEAVKLGSFTLIRVIVLIALATLVWVPLGILIGVRPALSEKIQPLAQFLAAFPANLLFPVAVVVIVHFHLHPDIWLSPLMILGTQWYILFNVIAGASVFPNDLKEAAAMFRVRGWQWWRRVMLPAVFPYYVTGALTASGGSWNASIVAEAVQWGDVKLQAHGIGSYIAHATEAGDYPRIILGIAVMAIFVTLLNRLVWRRLYDYAERRLSLT